MVDSSSIDMSANDTPGLVSFTSSIDRAYLAEMEDGLQDADILSGVTRIHSPRIENHALLNEAGNPKLDYISSESTRQRPQTARNYALQAARERNRKHRQHQLHPLASAGQLKDRVLTRVAETSRHISKPRSRQAANTTVITMNRLEKMRGPARHTIVKTLDLNAGTPDFRFDASGFRTDVPVQLNSVRASKAQDRQRSIGEGCYRGGSAIENLLWLTLLLLIGFLFFEKEVASLLDISGRS